MEKIRGLCTGCVRFHPKAVGNCILAKDWMFLSKKHGYTLMVVECPLFISGDEVFAEELNAQPVRTGNKKIDFDEAVVEE